jgi:hypothetical protein
MMRKKMTGKKIECGNRCFTPRRRARAGVALERRGHPIGPFDLLIPTRAQRRNLTL